MLWFVICYSFFQSNVNSTIIYNRLQWVRISFVLVPSMFVVPESWTFHAVRERCLGDGNAHTRVFKSRACQRIYAGVRRYVVEPMHVFSHERESRSILYMQETAA